MGGQVVYKVTFDGDYRLYSNLPDANFLGAYFEKIEYNDCLQNLLAKAKSAFAEFKDTDVTLSFIWDDKPLTIEQLYVIEV